MSDTSVTRRWLDKALLGAVVSIVALIGLIYGTLVRGVDDVAKQQADHERRITVVEQRVIGIERDVQEIKADVKSVLREVKK